MLLIFLTHVILKSIISETFIVSNMLLCNICDAPPCLINHVVKTLNVPLISLYEIKIVV